MKRKQYTPSIAHKGRLFLTLLLMLLTTASAWADGSCGDGVTWSYNGGTKTLTISYSGSGTGAMADYTFKHDMPWNNYLGDIRTVVIGSGVTSIGSYAFYDCSALTSVTIPDGVTSIGENAFQGCSALTSITIPDGVTSIGTAAFSGCAALTSIELPASVTSIGMQAFNGCRGLTSFTIPAGVTSIADRTFLNCSGLESVTFHNNVTSIDAYAFQKCSSLTSVTIPDGVKTISEAVFWGCTALASVEIPASVTSIDENAFYDCDALTSVTIPKNVKSIGASAFSSCNNLEMVIIKATSLNAEGGYGVYAFSGNASGRKIYVPFASVTTYKEAANWVNIKDDIFGYGFCGAEGHEEDVIGALTGTSPNYTLNIIKIGETGAMKDYYNLNYPWYGERANITAGVIGNGVTNLGDLAFYGCTGLTSVTIPDGVTRIGGATFSGCTGLTSVEIPASVTIIDLDAFWKCSSLTSVEIPANVTSIGENAFRFCDALTSVTSYAPELSYYGEYAFGNPDKLYVFHDCVNTYKSYTWQIHIFDNNIVPITLAANEGAEGEYWTTYYNELANAKVPEGAQAFKVTLSGTTLELTEITDGIISRGEAVVIKSTSANVQPEYSATGSSDTNDNHLQGTMKTITNPGNAYVLNKKGENGVGFYKLSATGTIGAHKAYLVGPASAPEFFLFSDATGISEIEKMRNAENETYYDLQGRRVAQPTKGLYIVNGKKVVIK